MTAANDKKEARGSAPGLKGVSLAGGRRQIVPGNLEVLNPEEEGGRAYLYLVWMIDPEHVDDPEDFRDCVEGRGICHPFGWFTDFRDLYRLGRHDTPMLRSRFEAATADYMAMLDALMAASERNLPEGTWWTFAWMLCDCMGGEVPVGTAPYAIETKGAVHE